MGHFSTFMRACGLVVGCLATGMAYSMDAFNVYADALKDLFMYKQSQVELIISLGNVGLLSSLPAGLLLRTCGFRILSLVGLIVSTGSYVLLCVSTYNVPYYSQNYYLIAIYYFFSGAGGGIMYITATTVNIRNFETRYLGLVSGLLHSMKSVVLGVIMATYQGFFSETSVFVNDTQGAPLQRGPVLGSTQSPGVGYNNSASLGGVTVGLGVSPVTEDVNTTLPGMELVGPPMTMANLRGFFATIALSYAVINLLAIIVYGSHPQESPLFVETASFKVGERQRLISRKSYNSTNTEETEDILCRSSCSVKVIEKAELEGKSSTPLGLLKSYYYHAILWPSFFTIAYRTCYINNLTSFISSMKVEQYSGVLLSLVPILGTVVKPVLGVISDATAKKVPRSAMLLLFLVLDGVTCLLCMTLFSHVSVITVGLVVAIFGSCTVQTQSPAILVETFGKDCFAYGWGFITLAWSLATLGIQMLYGALYDQRVLPGGNNYCYGQQCFTWFFAICAIMAGVIALGTVYAVVKQFKELRSKNEIDNMFSGMR